LREKRHPFSGNSPTQNINPFEVKAGADNSYGALNSNSLTQFNTALKELPVSADIFTSDFIRDVTVVNLEELMLASGTGAGVTLGALIDGIKFSDGFGSYRPLKSSFLAIL
jgi:hypothetical protein